MRTLRERLAGLSASRTEPRSRPLARFPLPTFAQPSLQPGHRTSEQLVPLETHPWLARLPAADLRAAALLTRSRNAPLPPLAEWLFLDLETTGLAGGTGTYAFLVGIGQLAGEGFRLRQFFLRDLAGEGALVAALAPVLRQASVLVSYNGKLFDVPLLETRFRLSRMPFDLDAMLHLDLLYPARRLWKRRWGSVRLTDLERSVLGYERGEDIPGELIPQLYLHYLRCGDERPLRTVFRHNTADLLTLATLAARMLHLLAAPETESTDPLELFALARLFERACQADRARTLYEQALIAGLPVEVERAALLRVSLLYKRDCNYQRAVSLWRELLESGEPDSGKETLEAYEELAICYEHRLRDLGAAAEVTRHGLVTLNRLLLQQPENGVRYRRAHARFTHRLRRLTRKRACLSPPSCT